MGKSEYERTPQWQRDVDKLKGRIRRGEAQFRTESLYSKKPKTRIEESFERVSGIKMRMGPIKQSKGGAKVEWKYSTPAWKTK